MTPCTCCKFACCVLICSDGPTATSELRHTILCSQSQRQNCHDQCVMLTVPPQVNGTATSMLAGDFSLLARFSARPGSKLPNRGIKRTLSPEAWPPCSNTLLGQQVIFCNSQAATSTAAAANPFSTQPVASATALPQGPQALHSSPPYYPSPALMWHSQSVLNQDQISCASQPRCSTGLQRTSSPQANTLLVRSLPSSDNMASTQSLHADDRLNTNPRLYQMAAVRNEEQRQRDQLPQQFRVSSKLSHCCSTAQMTQQGGHFFHEP